MDAPAYSCGRRQGGSAARSACHKQQHANCQQALHHVPRAGGNAARSACIAPTVQGASQTARAGIVGAVRPACTPGRSCFPPAMCRANGLPAAPKFFAKCKNSCPPDGWPRHRQVAERGQHGDAQVQGECLVVARLQGPDPRRALVLVVLLLRCNDSLPSFSSTPFILLGTTGPDKRTSH